MKSLKLRFFWVIGLSSFIFGIILIFYIIFCSNFQSRISKKWSFFTGSKSDVEYEKIIHYLDIVLELDPENDKALYRKGQAFKHLKKFQSAKDTFEELVKVQTKKQQPVPKDVYEDIKNCSKIVQNSAKQAKDMYSNMFKHRPGGEE